MYINIYIYEISTINVKKVHKMELFVQYRINMKLIELREMGLEPTRCEQHKILSLACLPIPALPPSK